MSDFLNVIYEDHVKIEIEDRKKPEKKHDYEIADNMLAELNQLNLGRELHYCEDLIFYTVTDKRAIPIFKKYIVQFNHVGIVLNLVNNQLGLKGYKDCTEFLIELFYNLEKRGERLDSVCESFDNAFCKIKDKRYIDTYLELISVPKYIDKFYLLLEQLSKWHIDEALPIAAERVKYDKSPGSAIKALGNYADPKYAYLIEPHLNSEKPYIRQVAKKALDKMNINQDYSLS